MTIAFITGVTGQDGSYLTEFLLEKNYIVHGVIRYNSCMNLGRIKHLCDNPNFHLHYGDLLDGQRFVELLTKIKPDEIYNLAAQSHVGISFHLPEYTAEIDGMSTLKLLNAIKTVGLCETVKFYQASTSELFGKVQEVPQKETTSFYPRSIYGISKLFSYWTVINFKEAYNLFGCNGILFNHESPRRGLQFVTRKITTSVAKIHHGLIDHFELGNLNALRDWGHAKDYVKCMWKILQQPQPDNFVIATGNMKSVRDFVEASFKYINVEIEWVGEGVDEIGIDKKTKKTRVKVNPEFFRPTEVEQLCGDSSKAHKELDWKSSFSFDDLVSDMMKSDLDLVKRNEMLYYFNCCVSN